MESNNYQNTSENNCFPYLNITSDTTNPSFLNQDINRLQRQDNISMITTDSNLHQNSPSSLNSLVDSLNRSRYLQNNVISTINPSCSNSLNTFNNINDTILFNRNTNQNICQPQSSNSNTFMNNDLNTNINQQNVKYSNLKSLLTSNQNLTLNSGIRRDILQTNYLNQNLIPTDQSIDFDPPILQPLFPVPHFTFEMLNKVNLDSTCSQDNNGHDLPFGDITTLRFFYNFGIQQFRDTIAKQQVIKNTPVSNNQHMLLLQQHALNKDKTFPNNDIKTKLNMNILSQSAESSIIHKSPENLNMLTALNTFNPSNNLHTNNLSLHQKNQSSTSHKNFVELFQQQQMNAKDSFDFQQKHSFPTKHQSLLFSNQQLLATRAPNTLQSQQNKLNGSQNNASISQNQIVITDKQKMPNCLFETLNNPRKNESYTNDETVVCSNHSNFTISISDKLGKNSNLIEKEEKKNGSNDINNIPMSEKSLNDKFSTICLTTPENSSNDNLNNKFKISTLKNKDEEVIYLLNKSKGNLHEFAKQFPVCVIQKVSSIINVLNNYSQKNLFLKKNDRRMHILEEFEDTISYQEQLLDVDKNHLLHLKIYKNGGLANSTIEDLFNSHSDAKESNDNLSLRIMNNKAIGSLKRRRNSNLSSDNTFISNNFNNPNDEFSLENDFIKHVQVKRFKKSNLDNKKFSAKDSKYTNCADLSSDSINLSNNSDSSHEFPKISNNSQTMEQSNVSTYTENFYITKEENNADNQPTFRELCNINSEKENENIEKLVKDNFTQLDIFKNQKAMVANTNCFTIPPFIGNYLAYIKKEFFRQISKDKRNKNMNFAVVNSDVLKNFKSLEDKMFISEPKESNASEEKIKIYNTTQHDLQNKNCAKISKSTIEDTNRHAPSLKKVQNFSQLSESSLINVNIVKSNTIPIKPSEIFLQEHELQPQIYSQLAFQRSTELEELLSKNFTK